ncbi:DNA polymerase processivity subunit [Cercopithecine alphaherpesvirus 2]|uniref:DNA polymerase processivity factor n=1 Tax=Cercopithecine alphaherpesvirus 2 TaxID=10317 RepID=Q5Y0R0_9ALPH|nr:DNA polymerase processivity subunit [Cercopithecine alphaherpesvirus 2]AAU88108.1 DNA polymerase subunit [Cercopithecine alphaherpesvirus 2]
MADVPETADRAPEPGRESDVDSDDSSDARSTVTCRLELRGPELDNMLRAFAPLRTCLLDSMLVFGERGLVVQCAIFGEQVFLPLGRELFSRYSWLGPPAAFLSLVDQKRSLLGALRGGQRAGPVRIDMTISGETPLRTLRQRVWVEDPESASGATELRAATLMKRELASFVVLLPQGRPDVQLRLTKPQLAKILALPPGPTTLELGPNGRFSASGGGVCVTFAAREEGAAPSTADSQMRLLSRALKKSDQAALAAKTICGTNLDRAFSTALDDGNWRAVLRRLQVGGATLKFFFGFPTPSLCVTATGPNSVSAVFLLDPRSTDAAPGGADAGAAPPAEETGARPPSKRALSPEATDAPARKKAPEDPVDAEAGGSPRRPPAPVAPASPEPGLSSDGEARGGVYARYFPDPPILRGPLFSAAAPESGAAAYADLGFGLS